MSALLEWGVASQPMVGETALGDSCYVHSDADGGLVVVVDALGHGREAARAADAAIGTVREHAGESLVHLFERCHDVLKRTRGVVMSAAAFSAVDNSISWLGVGNVEGAVMRPAGNSAERPRSFVVRGGVVGYQLPRLQVSRVGIAAGDSLVVATDGLASGFLQYFPPQADPQGAADTLLTTCARASDDALVVVARYCGAGS